MVLQQDQKQMPASPSRSGQWHSITPRSPKRDLEDAQSSLLSDEAAEQLARDDKLRKSVLLCFCLSSMFSQYMLITFMSPFLPRVIDEHGVGSSWVGVILAADALATCICSPIIGFLMMWRQQLTDSCSTCSVMSEERLWRSPRQ